MQSIVHVILAGLSSGMFIWLVASGLTLIFGVLGVLNFAHGSFYMLGAYVSYTLVNAFHPYFWLGVLIAPVVVAAVGYAMEHRFLRYVYHLPLPYQLLLTFAFVLIFDNLVKIIWGAGSLTPPVAAGLAGSVSIVGRKFPVYSLFIIAVGPVVALGLWAALEKTWLGRTVRAAASDREMAAALGVRVPSLFTSVFAFGAWLGALGGALAVPYVGLLTPGMGETIIIDAFIGALLIGILSAFGTRFFPAFDMFLTFILMAGVLLWRPRGLFGAAA